jgi:hypothetical protein
MVAGLDHMHLPGVVLADEDDALDRDHLVLDQLHYCVIVLPRGIHEQIRRDQNVGMLRTPFRRVARLACRVEPLLSASSSPTRTPLLVSPSTGPMET